MGLQNLNRAKTIQLITSLIRQSLSHPVCYMKEKKWLLLLGSKVKEKVKNEEIVAKALDGQRYPLPLQEYL